MNDQYSDVVANNNNASFRLKNGYGDINKSVMAFLDGHAAYYLVRPGNVTTVGSPNNSYTNKDYTFVFEDLKFH
jgi:prepilin-type processing-associated H-X9-DG protein